MSEHQAWRDEAIAVIGVATRLPGAPDVDTFWRQQMAMREAGRWISREQALTRGRAARDLERPDYVPLEATIEDIDCFDAPLFGVTAAEAELLDPQFRVLHELAWSVLDHGGYGARARRDRMGVFAASNVSTYWLSNLGGRYRGIDPNELLHLISTNSQDYLATTLSYHLELTGPALTIQTTCSSGLVLACTACQHLLDGSCDAALALAVSLTLPQGGGYLATSDSIYSPDGVCRPFDADANGTFASDGACGVLLKRLETAEEDSDRILAVIRGWALNNDGRRKIGFFAPSIEGQREVLAEAALAADITPGDLDYIETHGTGTRMGDPVEFQAIAAVHGRADSPEDSLALASVKGAVGHLGPAAGLCGLIRTVLALRTGIMPGTLNYRSLNPVISAQGTGLYVNDRPRPFPQRPRPARAGVSAFGIGGTNAHMILEALPPPDPCPEPSLAPSGPPCPEVIALSGLDADALARQHAHVQAWLDAAEPPVTEAAFPSLAGIADTLMHDRAGLPYRAAVVGETREAIAAALAHRVPTTTPVAAPAHPRVCFVFTGSGVPSLSHSRILIDHVPAFAQALQEVDAHLIATGHPPACDWLTAAKTAEDERALDRSHAAAFAFGYAHACMWRAMGVEPAVLLGHSMGEIAAACVAGAIPLGDAVAFTRERARVIQTQAEDGDLLAVAADATDMAPHLDAAPTLSIAGHNGVGHCLIAGSSADIRTLHAPLSKAGYACTVLPAGQPFHSPRMATTCAGVAAAAKGKFGPARIPVASTITGRIETDALADPAYWSNQMVTPVDLTAAIGAATTVAGCTVFLELGPRPTFPVGGKRTLIALDSAADWRAALTLQGHAETETEAVTVTRAIAETRAWLFEQGVPSASPHRRRAPRTTVPGYAFARKRYWREDQPVAVPAPGVVREDAATRGAPDSADTTDPAQNLAGEDLLRETLADLWRQELGLREVGGADRFVTLGGTSLVALKVIGAVERTLGVRPSVASLAAGRQFDDFVATVATLLKQDEDADTDTGPTPDAGAGVSTTADSAA